MDWLLADPHVHTKVKSDCSVRISKDSHLSAWLPQTLVTALDLHTWFSSAKCKPARWVCLHWMTSSSQKLANWEGQHDHSRGWKCRRCFIALSKLGLPKTWKYRWQMWGSPSPKKLSCIPCAWPSSAPQSRTGGPGPTFPSKKQISRLDLTIRKQETFRNSHVTMSHTSSWGEIRSASHQKSSSDTVRFWDVEKSRENFILRQKLKIWFRIFAPSSIRKQRGVHPSNRKHITIPYICKFTSEKEMSYQKQWHLKTQVSIGHHLK